MRIATFNCNSIRSRMDTVLAWLAANEPDILCLQETKVQDHEFPLQPLRDAGWHVAFKGMKAYNGVAIISKRAPDEVRFGLDDGGPADEPRLAWARFGKLNIVDTYVPQGREIDHEMFQYKLQWFERLVKFFAKNFTANDQLIWTGDINVAAEPMDVHNPDDREDHVCFHADVRKAFARTKEFGFVDVFRKFHPEPGHYTFFDYRTVFSAKRGLGWRIDYILATPPLAERAVKSWIDVEPRLQPKASDHTFLAADFDLAS
jgi:exodeoxyribonuclease III